MDRVIRTEQDRRDLINLIKSREFDFTVKILKGIHRTPKQNKLQRKWMLEAEDQLCDMTAEEYRGYCKLHFGVPILRNENEDFCEKYDKHIRPLSYETKIACMMVPLDFPVTRLMDTKQKTTYLDAVFVHFTGLGVKLTVPRSEK